MGKFRIQLHSDGGEEGQVLVIEAAKVASEGEKDYAVMAFIDHMGMPVAMIPQENIYMWYKIPDA